MKYRLLVRKIHFDKKKYIAAGEIRRLCRKIGIKYKDGINYLTKTKHLIRILRGFFYIRSLGERNAGTTTANFFEAIAKALKYKNVSKWYFGLDTAIKLNNLTHEYFPIDCVVSDRIFRSKPVSILGHKVKFIKLKKELFWFGIKSKNAIRYSDVEKTILDIAHIRRHHAVEDSAIRNEIIDVFEHANKKKLNRYAKYYSLSVRTLINAL